MGRRVYLSSELATYCPGERSFAPDILAVLDVEPHDRSSWIVDVEGKGLDFVMEVLVSGDRKKDLVANVERYARLGIREYFVFDRGRLHLSGYRLKAAGAKAYERIVPQSAHYASEVLGVDLVLDGERLRFRSGNAVLEETDEVVARLGGMFDKVLAREDALEAALEEERRAREGAEARLAEALAEIERGLPPHGGGSRLSFGRASPPCAHIGGDTVRPLGGHSLDLERRTRRRAAGGRSDGANHSPRG